MKLVHTSTGIAVNVGDVVADFRGEKLTVVGWPKDGRNRVYTKDAKGHEQEYYPSVINCSLVRE